MPRGVPSLIAAAAATLAMLTGGALAQDADFPSRPIRIILPYSPGATGDIICRAIASEATKRLGQPIVVEARAGGNTVIGTRAARLAPADGYTVLFQTSTYVSNLYFMKDPGYRIGDFTVLATISNAALVLLTPSSLPPKTLKEFIAFAKSNAGKLNFGSNGRGSRTHVLAEQLATAGGFTWTEIQYKGTADAGQAVMSGVVQGFFSTQGFATAHVASEKLRMLGVSSQQRVDSLPDVPTFREQGYPDIVDQTWYALFARSETPRAVIDRLRAAFTEAMRSPFMQAQIRNNGLSPYDARLEDFPAKMEADLRRLAEEGKRLGFTAQ